MVWLGQVYEHGYFICSNHILFSPGVSFFFCNIYGIRFIDDHQQYPPQLVLWSPWWPHDAKLMEPPPKFL